ncbi:MAG: HAMP domain-containing protein [Deltaproteobacteria bacterium]|nr:HAMP domain-containing protein [Deltaproteobacteria bacterium]
MKIPFYGLRAGILTQIIFLIVAAMLLINVVMVKFHEKDLIREKVHMGELLIRSIEMEITSQMRQSSAGIRKTDSASLLNFSIRKLLETGGFSSVVIVDTKGEAVFSYGDYGSGRDRDANFARDAMNTGSVLINLSGSAWGVFWLARSEISISAPILKDGSTVGGGTVNSSLAPIYRLLRKTEKLILVYIFLDAAILSIVGIYLISRIVVKPIHRLLKMTDEYKDGDMIPSFSETTGNEIGDLSRSLGNMLKRLDDNKTEMKKHISSLENANRELKKAQNEIIRSEKLASVGRLSAGIAHEIGNPIGIVLGYLELLKREDITEDERVDFLHRVESEIKRINIIIAQLLDFSRPSSGEKQACHVHQLIDDTVKIFRPQPMMEGIKMELHLGATVDKVSADPNRLQQVFLNILINTADVFSVNKTERQAKKSDDLLIIETKNIEGALVIKFVDNGPGIPESELEHIFDPFYSTKEPGKGTGLGLFVCYRIVEELNGTITAESKEEKGTTIMITLPVLA